MKIAKCRFCDAAAVRIIESYTIPEHKEFGLPLCQFHLDKMVELAESEEDDDENS